MAAVVAAAAAAVAAAYRCYGWCCSSSAPAAEAMQLPRQQQRCSLSSAAPQSTERHGALLGCTDTVRSPAVFSFTVHAFGAYAELKAY